MKSKTKSELMAEWASQPEQLKREREVKAIRKAMDDAGWKSGMSYADLKDLYGWHISDLKIYDRPRPLSDFTRLRATKFGYEPVEIQRPPQSWYYVEDGR